MIDRLRSSLVALVEQLLARTDYHASYPARVVSQNEDGSPELKPDDPRFGAGLSRVAVRGLPGVVARVRQGARVLLTWEGGNPGLPIATLFEAHSLERLEVTASAQVTISAPKVVLAETESAGRPVATVGSIVKVIFIDKATQQQSEAYGYVTDGVAQVLAGGS